jgi:hypothetical protein
MKNKFEVVFQEKAMFEVSSAYNYYEDEMEGLGDRFLGELQIVIKAISLSPNGFQKLHQYRQVPIKVFPYVVIYELIKKSIVVYAVFQTQQHPNKKLK